MKPGFVDIEELFAPIDGLVSGFAEKHSLRLRKCARGNTGWELVGERADGGEIFLLMMYDPTLGLGVDSVWQFPSPEMSLLYSHFRQIRPCAIEPGAVSVMLEDELEEILAVKFGYWTHILPWEQPNDARSG